MDTKWKNRVSLLAWLVLFTYGVCGVLAALFDDQEFIRGDYFETSSFEQHVDTLLNYVYIFEISYRPKEEVKKYLDVTNSEIESYRKEYSNIENRVERIEEKYKKKIQEAKAEGNEKSAEMYIKVRDAKIEEVKKILEDYSFVRNKILNNKEEQVDAYYKDLNKFRDDYEKYKKTFDYYLTNVDTGNVYTDLSSKGDKTEDSYINQGNTLFMKEYLRKQNDLLTEERLLGKSQNQEIYDLIHKDENTWYEGTIGVRENLLSSNFMMQEYQNYKDQVVLFWIFTLGAIISLLISIFIEKRKKMLRKLTSEKWEGLYHKVPIDIAVLLFGITVMINCALISEMFYLNYRSDFLRMLEDVFYFQLFLTLFYGLMIIQGTYLYRRIKDVKALRKDWGHSVLVRFWNLIKMAFLNRRVGTKVILVMIGVFVVGLVTSLAGVAFFIPAFFLIGVPLCLFVVKKVGYFNQITTQASSLAQGEIGADLKVKGKSTLAVLAEDLNKMKYGVKTSQKAQARSERLKTELITNVSHDLRTPLTSIITYSALLQNQELSEDERSSYIGIIDRKSKRLKVLIDDLFEASKMASGNIELVKEKVDIVQLLQQALAEYDETIQGSSLQFRVSKPEEPVYAIVDGQKLWRVFENLIGNILKYSLEQTRAYIQVREDDGQVMISFKNISEYELSDDIDELIERFKRGDESRQTEGSGLGLAIAKSIIDLHEGSFDIEVDGDLFKVNIVLDAVR